MGQPCWIPWQLLPGEVKEGYNALLEQGRLTDAARNYLKETVAKSLVRVFLESELPKVSLRNLTTINGERIMDVALERLSELLSSRVFLVTI